MGDTDEMKTGFTIQNSSADFASKSKDIFGGLDALESKHQKFEQSQEEDRFGWKSDPTKDDTDTISPAFKKPVGIPSRGRDGKVQDEKSEGRGHNGGGRQQGWDSRRGRGQGFKRKYTTPDYKLHPEKYTRYSLEDVSADDMSNRSNTQAALAFLEERRKLREGEMKEEAVDTSANACSKGMFVFAKKSKKTSNTEHTNKRPHEKKVTSRKIDVEDDSDNTDSKNSQNSANNAAELASESEQSEQTEESEAVEEKPIFKSHKKIGRRNIRSRESNESDED